MLATMFGSLAASQRDSFRGIGLAQNSVNGAYVIDRDGPTFRYVLAYLRAAGDKPMALPADTCDLLMLANESDYYMLDELSAICWCSLDYRDQGCPVSR